MTNGHNKKNYFYANSNNM